MSGVLGKDSEIRAVRAWIPGGGVDFSEKSAGSWLNGRMTNPMSRYIEYRASNLTWGRQAIGSFVVEVESRSGEVGFGVSTGGLPACWIVEHHLAALVVGRQLDIDLMWELMWRASLYYGRKGITIHALSAVDLALWDLAGKLRGEPVYALLGQRSREELPLYATTPRPDLAAEMGFLGGKLPLVFGPADGDEGVQRNLELAEAMRSATPSDFFLAFDAWMGLDVEYARRLIPSLADRGFLFLEDFLFPDDYWGFAEVKRSSPPGFLVATGEHESTRFGFRLLIDMECCDIIQPDVTWCGGLSELRHIYRYARSRGVDFVPHASSVYGYHFLWAHPEIPYGEFVVVSDDGSEPVPMYGPLFLDEPLPARGRIRISDRPGFGVEVDRSVLRRPGRAVSERESLGTDGFPPRWSH